MEKVYEDSLNNKNEITISKHAYDRMKSRNGWNRKTAERMIEKVYTNGLRPDQVKGYLKRWVHNKSQHDIEEKNLFYLEKNYMSFARESYLQFFQHQQEVACYMRRCIKMVWKM